MNQFRATTESTAVVPADRMEIWQALIDPDLLPRLTPLLNSIDTNGDRWTWHMIKFGALGVSITPVFTEKMTFDEGKRIDYTHAAPAGARETAGAEGSYRLADVAGGTKLDITLTVTIELPLPRAAGPAVRAIMQKTMDRTGEKFASNLLKYLGVSATA